MSSIDLNLHLIYSLHSSTIGHPQHLHYYTDNTFSMLARESSFDLSILEITFMKVLLIVQSFANV